MSATIALVHTAIQAEPPSALLIWGGAVLIALAGVGAAAAWIAARRLGDLARQTARLQRLDEIETALGRLAVQREDLDVRRLEHVLIDIRESMARMQEAVLRAAETAGGGPSSPERAAAAGLSERVVNRLLALGYERIELATAPDELARLEHESGDVLVEARRAGVVHKGRVQVREGRIQSVDVHPPFAVFP